MHPMEYEDCESKMGSKVVPALVVFQTPPEPTAINQTLGFYLSNAMSAMRPDIREGPILRNLNAPRRSGINSAVADLDDSVSVALGLLFWEAS